jgi:hypothetical protein
VQLQIKDNIFKALAWQIIFSLAGIIIQALKCNITFFNAA